jgi:hypothetical protein
MPVSSQKKRTTSTPDPSTSDPSSPVLPEQQVFHQYLRSLAQNTTQFCDKFELAYCVTYAIIIHKCTPNRD